MDLLGVTDGQATARSVLYWLILIPVILGVIAVVATFAMALLHDIISSIHRPTAKDAIFAFFLAAVVALVTFLVALGFFTSNSSLAAQISLGVAGAYFVLNLLFDG